MKRKTQRTYPLTADDARFFRQAADVLDGAWGSEPQRYLPGWLRLWSRYDRLKRAGVKVRISTRSLDGVDHSLSSRSETRRSGNFYYRSVKTTLFSVLRVISGQRPLLMRELLQRQQESHICALDFARVLLSPAAFQVGTLGAPDGRDGSKDKSLTGRRLRRLPRNSRHHDPPHGLRSDLAQEYRGRRNHRRDCGLA